MKSLAEGRTSGEAWAGSSMGGKSAEARPEPSTERATGNCADAQEALSALVVKGYGLDKAKADADVTAWMDGRSF